MLPDHLNQQIYPFAIGFQASTHPEFVIKEQHEPTV